MSLWGKKMLPLKTTNIYPFFGAMLILGLAASTHPVESQTIKTLPVVKEYLVRDIDGYVATTIENITVSMAPGIADGTSQVSIYFHVVNRSQSVQGDVALYVDLRDANEGNLPGADIALGHWRDTCYYGESANRRYDVIINVLYRDLVVNADHINLRYSPLLGRNGKC
jgi:hypothetical protein